MPPRQPLGGTVSRPRHDNISSETVAESSGKHELLGAHGSNLPRKVLPDLQINVRRIPLYLDAVSIQRAVVGQQVTISAEPLQLPVLYVNPTWEGRLAEVGQGDKAWKQVLAAAGSDADTVGMKNHFLCHWDYARWKPHYDLEPGRNADDWNTTVEQQCNPAGGGWPSSLTFTVGG